MSLDERTEDELELEDEELENEDEDEDEDEDADEDSVSRSSDDDAHDEDDDSSSSSREASDRRSSRSRGRGGDTSSDDLSPDGSDDDVSSDSERRSSRKGRRFGDVNDDDSNDKSRRDPIIDGGSQKGYTFELKDGGLISNLRRVRPGRSRLERIEAGESWVFKPSSEPGRSELVKTETYATGTEVSTFTDPDKNGTFTRVSEVFTPFEATQPPSA